MFALRPELMQRDKLIRSLFAHSCSALPTLTRTSSIVVYDIKLMQAKEFVESCHFQKCEAIISSTRNENIDIVKTNWFVVCLGKSVTKVD